MGFFEYDPIVSKDNLLLGIGFCGSDIDDKLWAKNLLDNCLNAVVNRFKDRTVDEFYWYFTGTLEELRERLPTLEEMKKDGNRMEKQNGNEKSAWDSLFSAKPKLPQS